MKSWNEIRQAATAFSKRWKDAYDEKSQAQSFLKEFFGVFAVDAVTVATRPLAFYNSNVSLQYYTHDGNKNVSDLTDSTQSLAAHYSYPIWCFAFLIGFFLPLKSLTLLI